MFGFLCTTVWLFDGTHWKPHLHEKLYCFSHPRPVALIGSFNPSGDDPEEQPEIIDEIGDQDLGHNVLVAIYDPALVSRKLKVYQDSLQQME